MRPEDQRWVDGLMAGGHCFEQTCRELRPLLVRAARSEIVRRAGLTGMSGPEPDDIACQAASDALLLIVTGVLADRCRTSAGTPAGFLVRRSRPGRR
jgi:RNA polymerase sigma-70 factor (ECF subfamily)